MKLFRIVKTGYTGVDRNGDGPERYDCYKVVGPITLSKLQHDDMDRHEARALASALNRAYALGASHQRYTA